MTLKKIAANHGLTPEGVDYALTQYEIVICEITNGIMSKPSYDAKDIIRTAEEHWCDTCKLKEHGSVKPIKTKKEWEVHSEIVDAFCCGNCRYELDHCEKWKYCPNCGRKIKWNNKENEDGT